MICSEQSGAVLSANGGTSNAILDFLRESIRNGQVDSVLLPVRVPSGDSFAWILTNDDSILAGASPIAPVMPVQGARALRSLTRKGTGKQTVLALMRPCEIRAAIELVKLGQVHSDNLILASFDCPGAMPLKDYMNDPGESDRHFSRILETGEQGGKVRPTCETCIEFSRVGSDIHFCHLGLRNGNVLVIPGSVRGEELLNGSLSDVSGDASIWQKEVERLRESRSAAREGAFTVTGDEIRGFSGMQSVFTDCIGCHNCQSACPICYCRLCYFDSETAGQDPDAKMVSAARRGGISLPVNRIMFHTGRMAHMSLSCVSCGQCTDVCPVSISVAEVFSFVADQTQRAFEYRAGEDADAPLPLREFRKSELPGIQELVKGADSEVSTDE
jgi:formate dehydrogenase subunit beta